MPLKNYHKVVKETPDDVRIFVQDSMHILERLHELLDEKFEGKQILLAQKLGKSEAEISKMLNGVQNFTLRTLSKLKAAFGESIIAVHTNHEHETFAQIKTAPAKGYARLHVRINGELKEEKYTPSSKSSKIQDSEKNQLV
jgi:transcriptional regulator with XRE-family HTH domain